MRAGWRKFYKELNIGLIAIIGGDFGRISDSCLYDDSLLIFWSLKINVSNFYPILNKLADLISIFIVNYLCKFDIDHCFVI